MRAVRGAAIDYINPAYHMACTVANNAHTYAPSKDLARLITANVNPRLAMLVVGFRKIATSITGPNAELNISELHTVVAADPDGVIPQADWDVLIANQQAYNAILDIAATVLGLNGISLMLKGHNYLDTDSMWTRLESAVSLDENAAALGIADYAGLLLHDALHPFSPDWKVQLASRVDSPLVGHVNGVLIKRMPGIPAGTTIVFVTRAAIEQINLIKPSTQEVLKSLADGLDNVITTIRSEPLEWCAMFQRADTAENLAHISKLEGPCALIYGACTVLFDKKMSILKSASFKNNASRHPGLVAIGASWAESLEDDEMDSDMLKKLLQATEEYLDENFEGDEPAEVQRPAGSPRGSAAGAGA
jgi:hypothetical protein